MPGFGDHDTGILTDMICHPQLMKPVKRRVYNWNEADMEKLRNETKLKMQNYLIGNSITTPTNYLWESFSNIIKDLQTKFVPNK